METVRNLAEILALFAVAVAGIAFVVKAVNGWFFTNLSMELDCSRTPLGSGEDGLAVKLSLSKGNRGTIALEEIAIGILSVDGIQELGGSPARSPAAAYLYPIEPDWILWVEKSGQLRDRQRNDPPEGRRSLRLTPGETTQFGSWGTFEPGKPCIIVASVHGRSMPHVFPESMVTRGRWQATTISAPLNVDSQTRDLI